MCGLIFVYWKFCNMDHADFLILVFTVIYCLTFYYLPFEYLVFRYLICVFLFIILLFHVILYTMGFCLFKLCLAKSMPSESEFPIYQTRWALARNNCRGIPLIRTHDIRTNNRNAFEGQWTFFLKFVGPLSMNLN